MLALRYLQWKQGTDHGFHFYERRNTRPLSVVTNPFHVLNRHPELLSEFQN
jgi:hypothetical protein